MSIDVTDVVLDPDMGGHAFQVVRESDTVDNDGLRQTTWTKVAEAFGSVQPADSSALERLPEAERLNGAIMVYTPFPLSAGSGDMTADVVWWGGRHYTVKTVNGWQFGRGWTAALCTLRSARGAETRRP